MGNQKALTFTNSMNYTKKFIVDSLLEIRPYIWISYWLRRRDLIIDWMILVHQVPHVRWKVKILFRNLWIIPSKQDRRPGMQYVLRLSQKCGILLLLFLKEKLQRCRVSLTSTHHFKILWSWTCGSSACSMVENDYCFNFEYV